MPSTYRPTVIGVARIAPMERSPLLVLLSRAGEQLRGVDLRLATPQRLACHLDSTSTAPTVVVPLSLTPQRQLLHEIQTELARAGSGAVVASALGTDGTIATALGRRLLDQGLDSPEDVCLVVAPFGWESEVEVSLAWAGMTIQAQTPARVIPCRADRLEEQVRHHRSRTRGHVAVVPWELVTGSFTVRLRQTVQHLPVPVLDPVGPTREVAARLAAAYRHTLGRGRHHPWTTMAATA